MLFGHSQVQREHDDEDEKEQEEGAGKIPGMVLTLRAERQSKLAHGCIFGAGVSEDDEDEGGKEEGALDEHDSKLCQEVEHLKSALRENTFLHLRQKVEKLKLALQGQFEVLYAKSF